MKRIIYLLIISLLFIPNVKALNKLVTIDLLDGVHHYYGNNEYFFGSFNTIETGNHKLFKISYNPGGAKIVHSTALKFELLEKDINLTQYESMIFSLYGSPVLSVATNNNSACTPVVSNLAMYYDNNNQSSESMFMSTYQCDINFTPEALWFEINYTWTSYSVLNIPNYVTLIPKNSSTSDITGAINNQTEEIKSSINEQTQKQEETNNKLNDINDTMNNDEVDTDTANSFFGGFSDTDHGGISGVVTAPLRFINKLTSTCSPISIDVLGANVQLPCGDTLFWNKSEVSSFRTIWNILFGGFMLYALVSKLFKTIDNLKNPDDSRIEVMKL